MLRLSTRGIYGVKALYELACNFGGSPVSIADIAGRHGLPTPFLEQVLNRLKHEGLVVSKRGAGGGYFLARSPESISLGDAIRAIEGPIALCGCQRPGNRRAKHAKERHCVTAGIYRTLAREVESAFDAISLRQLANEHVDDPQTGTC